MPCFHVRRRPRGDFLKAEDTLRLHETDLANAAYDLPYSLRADEETLITEFFPPAPARIVDLGCGNGRTTIPLWRRGYDVVGIEYSPSLVQLAKRNHPDAPIQQGDARSLPFADGSHDAALFAWNGIDYMYPLEERQRVLREVYRILRPGGLFLFSSHNALGCIARLFQPTLLTKRAVRFWRDQLAPRRRNQGWYFIWRDDALGLPLFYSAPPRVQVRVVQEQNWRILAVRSAVRPHRRPWTLLDVHVHYVCQKPA